MAAEDEFDFLSEDPEERLRLENEILKLKLRAELGSALNSIPDIPLEVENAFLKHMLTIAQLQEQATTVSVFQLVGEPRFTPYDEISEADLSLELERLEQIMTMNNVVVSYGAEYSAAEKYYFITEELFPEEVFFVPVPDTVLHFVYEDFHPQHEQCVFDVVLIFIEEWMTSNCGEVIYEMLAPEIVHQGQRYDREELIERMELMFEFYTDFEDVVHDFKVNFADPETGAEVAGNIRYTAILDDGEKLKLEGPFRMDLVYDKDHDWRISFFEWPGFEIV